MDSLFQELEFHRVHKSTESIPGDAYMMKKDRKTERLIAVLADGLGSGVKANILANMTARMALKFAESNTDFLHYAKVIMDALPVCQTRQIAYSTFTVIDCRAGGQVRVVEQGNPPFVLLRNGKEYRVPCREFRGKDKDYRKLLLYEFQAQPEDRIVFFSDGVTEAGLGGGVYKLGWRREGCVDYLKKCIADDPSRSARQLARDIVREAIHKEPGWKAGDDITCGVIYFRKPRRTLLASGPPFEDARDQEYAHLIRDFDGRKIISGGTSANIVARELDRPITTDLSRFRRSGLPPVSTMEGIDLVTEGILTLTKTFNWLEGKKGSDPQNAAALLAEQLLDSDEIHLLVGTKINEAHQDPNLPIELEIRRSLLKRIAAVLEETYLKEVYVRYI
jgi:serine/threonine protein phosphatase PrpC